MWKYQYLEPQTRVLQSPLGLRTLETTNKIGLGDWMKGWRILDIIATSYILKYMETNVICVQKLKPAQIIKGLLSRHK